ncbi:SMP-30/gluconolactonase/LRE family protein [Spirosoma jeollabukense]
MQTNHRQISCFVEAQCSLGEGPVWDTDRNGLWWVDIVGQQVHFAQAGGYPVQCWNMPEPIGFVLPRADGQLWAGLKSGLHLLTLPPTHTFSIRRLNHIDTDHPTVRFNDATLDSAGNLYATTMDMETQTPLGTIIRYSLPTSGQHLSETVLVNNFMVANGPALSPDGQTLYILESSGHPGRTKGVWRTSLREDGQSETDTLLFDWPYEGSPDGGTTDSAGNLWVGHYGGDTIRQYSAEGQLLQAIQLPVVNPTKVAIHPDGTLFVTSAREGASNQQLIDCPLTGSVLKIQVG